MIVLVLIMVAAGVMHFVAPKGFVRIVPEYLPYPLLLVYISGFFEILGGLGLLVERVRPLAAWGLIALYVAVFPANVNMAVHGIPFSGTEPQPLLTWARLPLQALLIFWAYQYTRRV
jgi:uncharacterized membrane protein